MAACGNPECEFLANSDPEVSVGFCCEKCEGRFNGEEWGNAGKRHTAYCTSKTLGEAFAPAPAAKGGAWSLAAAWSPNKCKHPECEYMVHSDMSVVRGYCCEKCEGLAKGEEWAEGGKRHYKSCEKNEGGGGMDFGGPWGGKCGWGKGGYPGVWDMFAAMKGGKFGKGCGKDCKGKVGKGKSGSGGLRNFAMECKVWVGNVPTTATSDELKEHISANGMTAKFVHVGAKGSGGIAFATAEEAAEALITLNGSLLGDNALQVDVWTQYEKPVA